MANGKQNVNHKSTAIYNLSRYTMVVFSTKWRKYIRWREETKGHVKIGFPPPPPFFSQDRNHNLGSANHPQTLILALLRLVKKDFLNYRTSFRKCKNNILRYGRGCLNITYS